MSAADRGIVYGLRTLDPQTLSTIELGYVGKTRQRLRARETQHREEQPWEDIIVGSAYIICQGLWTENELASNEAAMIRLLKPRYNVDGNGLNVDRIGPELAIEQRKMRDRARGVPLWCGAESKSVLRRLRTEAPVAAAIQEPKAFEIFGHRFEVAQFPTWDSKAFFRAIEGRPPAAMHKGHRAVLRQVHAGLDSPSSIARAIGYSERQVHNLLCDLVTEFGMVYRPRFGKYAIVEDRS